MTKQEIRKLRLANDYQQMRFLATYPMFSWEVIRGQPPHAEAYRLKVKVRTYKGENQIMNECTVRIELPALYPDVAPDICMEGEKCFNPNWFTNGKFCPGHYNCTESLGSLVVRMYQSLQYDSVVTNPWSAANNAAAQWYKIHQNDAILFPSDKSPLPDPNRSYGLLIRRR